MVHSHIISVSVPHFSIDDFHVVGVLFDVEQWTFQPAIPDSFLNVSVTKKKQNKHHDERKPKYPICKKLQDARVVR